jgi:hypothetical protein
MFEVYQRDLDEAQIALLSQKKKFKATQTSFGP